MGFLGLDESIVELGSSVLGTAENFAEDRSVTKHKLDSTSPFKLPHLIRPITLLWHLALKTILDITSLVLSFIYIEDDMMLVAAVAAIATSVATPLTMVLKYYFQGRTAEKRDNNIAKANIEIKKMEIEAAMDREEMILESEMDEKKLNQWIEKREVKRKNRLFGKNKKD